MYVIEGNHIYFSESTVDRKFSPHEICEVEKRKINFQKKQNYPPTTPHPFSFIINLTTALPDAVIIFFSYLLFISLINIIGFEKKIKRNGFFIRNSPNFWPFLMIFQSGY